MSSLIWYDFVIPRATQDQIDARMVSAFFESPPCEVTRGRWVYNALLDKRGEKTSWAGRATAVMSTAQARRTAAAINVVLRARPEWGIKPIDVGTVELIEEERT